MKKLSKCNTRFWVTGAMGLALAMLPLVSCESSGSKHAAPRGDVDTSTRTYTDADALNTEVSVIRNMIDKESVKAMWRAKLLLSKNASSGAAKTLFADTAKKVHALYSKSLSAKKYLEAVTYYDALRAVEYPELQSLPQGHDALVSLLKKNVPGLKPVANTGATVSDYIKGTVTVYVDKGIKVQHGVGYSDGVLGSGFFISSDGYIVTNHHVIADCVDPEYDGFARLYIRLSEDPDTKIPAKIIGYDSSIDLALLKTEVSAPYVFNLGSSSDLDVGDKVSAIGSPLGLERTLTSGVISSKDRELFSSGKVFQIDTAVNSGNSGGPLIDSKGNVQAVVFAGVQNYQGLNFAIPVEYLKNELPILYAGGERKHPWVAAYGKTKRRSGSGAENEGLSVEYVMPGGSALRADLAVGDTVIACDGVPISSIDDLKSEFMKRTFGTIVVLSVLDSAGEKKDRIVYLDERPEWPGLTVYEHDALAQALVPIIGMDLTPASTQNKKSYIISRVIKGSIADQSGFSENDPVEIIRTELSKEKDAIAVQLYAKKRKNGFLDVALGFTAALDDQFYF